MKDSTSSIRLQTERTSYREHSAPIFLTSSFVYESAEQAEAMFAGEQEGDIYSRFTNPNTTELIKKLSALENTEDGVVTSSGMAAIFQSLTAYLSSGDHLLASTALFGNSLYIIREILPKWGIEYTLVNMKDKLGWEKGFRPNTKMVLIETPSNPGLELIDIEWLSDLSRKNGTLLNVDNCFATPFAQKPTDFGADMIIHSATKFIDGQGRVLGGAVLGSKEVIEPIFDMLRRTGPCLSPFNAWLLSKSLETLEIRMERHCQNALALAQFLEKHTRVESVRYPFLPSHDQYELAKKQMSMGGGIVTCEIIGGKSECFQVINQIKNLSITANLGDSRTIITHPSTTTHSKLSPEAKSELGISDSTVRISVGLEHIDDIIEDLDQALNSLK